ncbi:PadR family transcriptional regulator [Cellulomonas fimi]|uniref:Transcriptional regulator PadR family protein n=1 Tax=Cellulomonas fimi (strain ATCC 484 / DSM 20113 / JCM 1341 / CCUG 24087 / LMG 16345 / NBRC 15513 / NCIMB 8980 / NCTC 7547 / NRS-133) TaxID=590998 RepID=F4H8P8_CELFA|nr:PadR family transcriptional regulator [Cellulomonas fimi]AEE47056.1 transcriptional regulator PadR family protein [Cellulomonas fimi ATCC 484]NNH07800.1 helix-turn-helix transcriptional regulator [Cellulomonas fimi]VEH34989.1 transcriptional regulator, Acidobacterial, PadR-family [Cellulomonas fimi]
MAELSAVAVLVLGLLRERPRHPYDVFQTLVERGDARLVRVNPGAVYHAVERLERDGLVAAVGTERCGNRPERTTYRLTTTGRDAYEQRLASFLGDEHPVHPVFPVGLAEAVDLPRTVVVDALSRRRAREAERLARLEDAYDQVRADGLPRRYLLDVEHDVAHLRHEVAWLDATLAELADDTLDWGAPFPADFARARHARRAATLAAPAAPATH